tara:strand:+ start:22040 stop:23521 length:1482 start_codon:yes stop_codon:yes gene_type:complete
MRTKLFISFGLLSIALALYAVWQVFYAMPQRAEMLSLAVLQGLSDETGSITVESSASRPGHLSLQGIVLDKDGFNRIEQIDLHYSLPGFYFQNRIEMVKILAADLTYSFDESQTNQKLRRLLSSPAPDWLRAVNGLDVQGVRLNLLTQNMGALRVDIEGILRGAKLAPQSLQFQVKAAQKQLSGALNLSGIIEGNRNWHIDASLDDARMDHDQIKVTRVTGQMTLDNAGERYYAKSEFNIGGLRGHALPSLTDLAVSYELDSSLYKFVLAGKALGHQEIELGLTYHSHMPGVFRGSIYTPNLTSLLEFYNGSKTGNDDSHHSSSSRSQGLSNVFLGFEVPAAQIFTPERDVLVRFNQLDIADFAAVFDGKFYGNGVLNGAAKLRLSPGKATIGGVSLGSPAGHFVLEPPLANRLYRAIQSNEGATAFTAISDDLHYKNMRLSVTGAEKDSGKRQVDIRLSGRHGADADEKDAQEFSLTVQQDLRWFWNALLGK